MKLDQLWPVIQNRICRKCVDGDGTGLCRLPAGEECPLKHFLPEIVQSVTAVDSPDIRDYVTALRKTVCANCDFQTPDLFCGKRSKLECALDRYFPLVVEIIETVKNNGKKIAV